jgi:hypothetical protein
MKSLLWKEFQENLKWAVLPALPILGPMAFLGPAPLLNNYYLFYVGLIAAVFGAALGFVQVFFEAQGDKRSLLLHRPISRSQIFLGKALAGVGLYLLALGIPFAVAVAWAATPGQVEQPFFWPMAFPWLADVLTGLVYYFAGMLTAQREARWYGSRCLGLAAAFFVSCLVWTLPEFRHALLAIVLLGGVVAGAAWGSFLTGGAYAPQPRRAKMALAATFLMGLSAVSFVGKVFVGGKHTHYAYQLDRQGRLLLTYTVEGKLQRVTDLHGQVPPELQGKPLDDYALKEITAPRAGSGAGPRTHSYRNQGRFLVEYGNETMPGGEEWWYVPALGRLLGYEKDSNHLVGSFGPDGFCPPGQESLDRFQGELLTGFSVFYNAWARDYLPFADRVYAVDFRNRRVQTLFVPAAGETVLWASRWKDEKERLSLAVVATDQSVHVLDDAGTRILSVPRACDPARYRASIARLENPPRYGVWYTPAWHLELAELETLPHWVVEYDRAGRELARRTVPPLPVIGHFLPVIDAVEPSSRQVLTGLVTPLAEAAVLVGAMQYLVAEFRAHQGREMWLLLQFLVMGTTYFLPGAGLILRPSAGLLLGFTTLLLLTAAGCALVCYLLARRYSFSRARCIGWALGGFLFGPVGLLLLLALQEWPTLLDCPSCGQPRRADRACCEHCGAAHGVPARDGTEIFEESAAELQRS